MTDDPSPDSGQGARSDAEPEHRHLRDIFMATTDVEEFTETQRARSPTIADEESVSVREAVATFVKNDGLTDTYAELVYKSDGD